MRECAGARAGSCVRACLPALVTQPAVVGHALEVRVGDVDPGGKVLRGGEVGRIEGGKIE